MIKGKKGSPDIKKVRSLYGITEYRLGNGLRVLFKQVPVMPVVAVCVTFHVGSRNEAPGHTGSTHVLEHLLFKDSKHFNKKNGKSIAGYLDWLGAYVNATTWVDRTNYFELLPHEHLEKALALEADRMRNSLFSEGDLQSEMPVVRNEYERGRNNPFELLEEEVTIKAFDVHPYRIPTIGTKEDIENSTATKLREFYDTFYWPNNATLSVFGDVSWKETQPLILKYFGKIPSSPHAIPEMNAVEPEQKEARSISPLEKPLGITAAMACYKIPQGTHPDYAAIVVLATILGGGFSSRLHRALVDTGKAVDIGLSAPAFHDPGLLTVLAQVSDGIAPESLLQDIRKEIKKFAKEGPTAAEVSRAKERILTSFASSRDSVFGEIRAVSESIAAGDWTLDYRLEEEVKKITGKKVANAAQKYLTSNKETSGILHNAQK